VALDPAPGRLAEDWRWPSALARLRGGPDGVSRLAAVRARFARFWDSHERGGGESLVGSLSLIDRAAARNVYGQVVVEAEGAGGGGPKPGRSVSCR